MLDINEAINVWVFFEGSKMTPFIFFWQNRRIKIKQVNLMHTSKDGDNLFYYFSVSAGENFYRLKFDSKNFKWTLEAVEEGV